MSGAEAAASIALDLSPNTRTSSSIYHIVSRPFWAVPTYLPANDQPGSFLPLDIVMYDLARRPPGDIQYSLGPLTSDRARIVHNYFESLIGSNQSDVAKDLAIDAEKDRSSAPWVAVTDHYAELVRAGDIIPTLGRVSAAHWVADAHVEERREQEGKGVVEVASPDGGIVTIDNVAAIVLATGFTPFDSLSFLPADVLAALEYSDTDTVFPIVLDEKSVRNPNVPDLGFVGMYRGPYWGVMEMQARALARQWSLENTTDSSCSTTAAGLDKLRDLRTSLLSQSQSSSSSKLRAQFPMGDYVGLMETFARELDIPRVSLQDDKDSDRSGPVIPARYFTPTHIGTDGNNPAGNTSTSSSNIIVSLQNLLRPSNEDRQRALCRAVLRALHGKWRYERRETGSSSSSSSSGQATIHLRKVRDATGIGYRTEYIYDDDGGDEMV